MNKIEEINRYIERTGVKYADNSPYQMAFSEIIDLYDLFQKDWYKALCLAFNYGRAKGERHARKELKKA